MVDNTTSTVLGTIGTVLWCIQLVPQVYFLHKNKDATGFPPLFMLLWCISGVFMCVYFVMSDSYIPMQLQPHLFTALCSVACIQAMHYPPYSYSSRIVCISAFGFLIFWIAIEVAFIVWLRPVYLDGKHWPNLIFGILATIFLCAGLVPPYFELAQRKGRVVGINFIFLAMDSSGAIFSMAAMCVGTFDPMGMALYAAMIAMEGGLFLSQGIWWLRFGRSLERDDADTNFDNSGTIEQLTNCNDGERNKLPAIVTIDNND